MPRNPDWTRDEIILALDLYHRVRPPFDESDAEVVELSQLLGKLPIHPPETRSESFRNPAGVAMKLSNFLRLDPQYQGVGLQRGARLEEQVWSEYCNDWEQLTSVAEAIKTNYLLSAPPLAEQEPELDDEFPEGRILAHLHQRRERSAAVVRKKKQVVLSKEGSLQCEVCRFDFVKTYGQLGEGFIECHHTVPLCNLRPGQKTRLPDLALVCANCHRMLHRRRPWLSVEQLRQLIQGSGLRHKATLVD